MLAANIQLNCLAATGLHQLQSHSCVLQSMPTRLCSFWFLANRLDSVGKELTDCRDTLEDTRQGFASLQTHHAALKLQLERSELHSRDSAAQAQDFHTRVTDLTADRDGLASQLANLTGTDKQLKKNLKCIVRCLKASNPLHSVLHYAEELSSESADDHAGTACTALQSDLKWVMHRLSELFKEGSLAQSQAASSAADSEKLQEKLSEHLEASKASSAALQTELAAAHGKVFKSESEVQLLQQQVTQHAQQLTTLTEEKISAEQQIAELRAAENELRTVEAELREEVQELQGKLKAAQGQLQASEGHLQAEVRRLQGQMLQARGEEEEAQEQRRILKQQHNKVHFCFSLQCCWFAVVQGKLRATCHDRDTKLNMHHVVTKYDNMLLSSWLSLIHMNAQVACGLHLSQLPDISSAVLSKLHILFCIIIISPFPFLAV